MNATSDSVMKLSAKNLEDALSKKWIQLSGEKISSLLILHQR